PSPAADTTPRCQALVLAITAPSRAGGTVTDDPMSTGLPHEDAKTDFARERRRRALAKISARLRSEPEEQSAMLPFEEVVGALGRRSQRDLGVQTIPL